MSSKNKSILAIVLVLIVCMSLVIGATYALFIVKTEHNIDINAADVKTSSEVKFLKYRTLNMEEGTWKSADEEHCI